MTWFFGDWTVNLTAEGASDQHHVADSNDEEHSDAWLLLHSSAQLAITEQQRFSFGISNLLDTFYRDHLAGTARLASDHTAVGSKLPGAGLNGWARYELTW